jgi:Protein of unknown function (DUF3142)
LKSAGHKVAFYSAVTSASKATALLAVLAAVCAAAGLRGHGHRSSGSPLTVIAPENKTNDRRSILPGLIFWAWERPEDLRFLGQQAGVAFLAKTIYIQSSSSAIDSVLPARFDVRPRLQPLRVGPNTPLIAVVRIETSTNARISTASASTPNAREDIASEIAALQNIAGVGAIQIDFDATTSQHSFYSALLQDVRGKLRSATPLSITALASWCIGDGWLAQLPPGTIDEAVPMLFRMGTDSPNVATFLQQHKEFTVPACRNSVGVSTDEPFSRQVLTKQFSGIPEAWRAKRIYVFAPRAWTPASADPIVQEWQP